MSDLDLQLLYLRVPQVSCRGLCTKACGPIDGFPAERSYFERSTGKPFPEALKVLKSGSPCPHLDPLGRCDSYAFRPLVCRLYGAVEAMRCPYGCHPTVFLTESQAHVLMMQARALR